MAVHDRNSPSGWDMMADEEEKLRAESLWDSQRKLMADILEQWQSFVTPTPAVDPARFADEMRIFMSNAAAIAQATTKPLADFLEAQRRYAARMEQWAQLQNELAQQTMALARQQQDIVGAVERWTAPLRAFDRGPETNEP